MMLFWIFVAVMILVAVGLFAPALLRNPSASAVLDQDQQNVVIARERLAELETELRDGKLDQAQFDQAKLELEQALLIDLGDEQVNAPEAPSNDRSGLAALAGLGIFVPVMTLWIYFAIGSPELVDGPKPAQVATHTGGEGQMPSLEEMVGALKARLAEAPEDSNGWYLLGRTYMAIEEYADAAQAFERLYQLVGDEPKVMLSLADAQAMAQGGAMRGRPAELVRKAVQLVPTDTTALWLAGIAEDQEGNHQEAISYWNRLRPLLEGDTASLERVDGLIASATEKGKLEPGQAAVMPEPKVTPGGKVIRVRVDLDPALRESVTPDDILFVFARALSGPRMPLAAARHRVSELPLELTLDDGSAMTPEMKLSNFDKVLVGARVSKSGSPIAGSGDLTGQVSPVNTGGEEPVDILIDTRLP